jgi:hypothetical protein
VSAESTLVVLVDRVSTTGEAPLTSTVDSIPPTGRLASRRMFMPAGNCCSDRLTVVKPDN